MTLSILEHHLHHVGTEQIGKSFMKAHKQVKMMTLICDHRRISIRRTMTIGMSVVAEKADSAVSM